MWRAATRARAERLHLLLHFQLALPIHIGRLQRNGFRQWTGLLYTGIDLIRAESHQLCVCFRCGTGKPDRQLHIGAVSLLRVVGAVTGIRNSCGMQNDTRALLKIACRTASSPAAAQKPLGKAHSS